jgi:NTE family protein
VLGDVWMTGMIAGLVQAGTVDPRLSGGFVGTSAGSIVATRLAAGEDLDSLVRRYVERPGEGDPVVATVPPGDLDRRGRRRPLARLLAGHGRAGSFMRRRALAVVPPGKQELRYLKRDMESVAPGWPERLNVVAFNAVTGKRVVFSRGDTHGLTVSEAVQASCAIPAVFRPVEGPDGMYVDGGVWSPVNLDAVPAEAGSSVVCLTPSGSYQGARGLGRRAAGKYFRAVVAGEVDRLRSRGVRVLNVVPDGPASQAIGPNRMASGREAEVYEAGAAQGSALAGPLSHWLDEPATARTGEPINPVPPDRPYPRQ